MAIHDPCSNFAIAVLEANRALEQLNEPTPVGLCVQGIVVINEISDLQILKY